MEELIEFEWVNPVLPEEAILVGRIEAGELSWTAVEAQRREAGLPPLAGWADPAGFDPRQKINWTLPMAVAWVIWRTFDAVREEMPDYRKQSTFWNSRGAGTETSPTRWSLEHKKPRWVSSIVSSAHAFDRVQVVVASSAEDALLRKLQDENSGLTATGLPGPCGRRQRITAEEWEDMTSFDGDRHHDGALAQGDSKPRWYEVRVKLADVLRLWPSLPASDASIANEPAALGEVSKGTTADAVEGRASEMGPAGDAAKYRTGVAGRPGSIHLILEEMKARARREELLTDITSEAKHLAVWLSKEHSQAAPLTPKSIRNGAGSLFRALKKVPKKN